MHRARHIAAHTSAARIGPLRYIINKILITGNFQRANNVYIVSKGTNL